MVSILSSKAGVTWTDVSQPTTEELADFARQANVLPADAEFIALDHHRAEVTVRPGYVLLLLQVPVFNTQLRVTTAAPLFFIIKDAQLWTLHYEPLVLTESIQNDFRANPDKVEEYFSDGTVSLALHIITAMFSASFRKLDRLSKHISIAEDAVFQGNERKMVEEISILLRDVIDFRAVIRPQLGVFEELPDSPLFTDTTRRTWSRLHGQNKKLWEVLASLLEGSQELRVTNGSLLQFKQNELLRVLTYYSIVSIPVFILLTPFNPRGSSASSWDAVIYWGILATLVLVLLGIFLRFRNKRVF